MILDNMSLGEAEAHILRLNADAMSKIKHTLLSKFKFYQRIMYNRGNKKCCFRAILFEREKVQFYIFPYSLSKKDLKKNGIRLYITAKIIHRKTTYWCLINTNNTVGFYKKHLFQRYLERHCGKQENSSVSLENVRAFFEEIGQIVSHSKCPSEGHPNGILGGSNIGTICGDLVDGVMVWRTFIDVSTAKNVKKLVQDKHMEFLRMMPIAA